MVIHILHEVIALCLGCREAGKSDDVGEHTEHSPCVAPSLFVPANGAPLSAETEMDDFHGSFLFLGGNHSI